MTEEHKSENAPSFRSLAFSFWEHPIPKSGREKKIVWALIGLWSTSLGLLLFVGSGSGLERGGIFLGG